MVSHSITMKNIYTPLIFLFFFTSFICLHAESTGNLQQQTIENTVRINELEKKVESQTQQCQNETDKKIADAETRMGIKKENIEYRSSWITIWLTVLGFLITVFGVVIPIGGFFYGRSFLKEINQDLAKQKIETRESLNQFINDSKERMELLEKEACSYIDKLKSYEADGKARSNQLQELLNKASNPNLTGEEKAESKAEAKAIANNKESSPYEKDMAKALSLYFENKYQESTDKYLEILHTYPSKITLNTLADLYFKIAYNYNMLNELEKSIEYYQKTINFNKDHYLSYNNWGSNLSSLAKLHSGDDAINLYNEAIEKYNKTICIKPDLHMAYNNYAEALISIGNEKQTAEEKIPFYSQAAQICQKAIELGGSHYNLACAYALLKKKKEAFMELEISIDKKDQTFEYVEKDPDWDQLREEPEYKKLKEKYTQS